MSIFFFFNYVLVFFFNYVLQISNRKKWSWYIILLILAICKSKKKNIVIFQMQKTSTMNRQVMHNNYSFWSVDWFLYIRDEKCKGIIPRSCHIKFQAFNFNHLWASIIVKNQNFIWKLLPSMWWLFIWKFVCYFSFLNVCNAPCEWRNIWILRI